MGQNQGITPGHNESCSSQMPSFRDPSWLRGYMCTQGNVPLQVRCEKRNWIIGLKEDKDPEELPYINDLTASLPCSSSRGGCSHPSSLAVRLPCFCLWVLSLLFLCCVSDNKLCTCIYSFCLCDKGTFFTGDKYPGENNFLASSPCWSGV